MNKREENIILYAPRAPKNYLGLLCNCLLLVKSSQEALVTFIMFFY